MKRLSLVALSGLILSTLFVVGDAPPSAAWNSLGCKFPTTTPRYHIVVNQSPTTDIISAAHQWNSRQSDVTLVNGSSSNWHVRVRNRDLGNTSWSGLFHREGSLTAGVQCSGGTWVTGQPAIDINNYHHPSNPTARRGVAVHEFGHALGLDHNNAILTCPGGGTAYRAVMYFSDSRFIGNCSVHVPQTDDINGVKATY